MSSWPRFSLAVILTVAVAVGSVFFVRAQTRQRETRADARVHLERGMQLYDRKVWEHAEDELRLALRADPEEWRAPYYVGLVQIDRKRYGLAIPYLERALALNPREAAILNATGVAYFKLGRLDMARGYFWAALAADPDNTDAKGLMETMAKLQWRHAQAGTESDGHAPAH